MKFPVITLLTDFGVEDAYVGTMKGVILSINPRVQIVDICHEIAPQDIFEGAYVLWTSYRYFPKGTIHVAVVDPGVGGARSAICASVNGHIFVAPDNGLLSFVVSEAEPDEIVRITRRKYLLPRISRTFHGRDIFAPAAAHISTGLPIGRLGASAQRLKTFPVPKPRRTKKGEIEGEVIHIDRFGNLVTNIVEDMLPARKEPIVRIGRRRIIGISNSYEEVASGALLAIVGSAGLLEISVNGGSAAKLLRASREEGMRDDALKYEQWDKRYVWHPFTQMKDYLAEKPTIIVEGEGAHIRDIEGNDYIDGVSSLWCNVHGHRRREIDEAIRRQLDKIAHSTLLGLANVPSIELARVLVEITTDGLEKVFYSDDGATAMEVAVKIAYQFWRQRGESGRKKFVALKHAYHGDTLGAVSLGGIELFHEIYRPLLFDVLRAPAPYCYRCEFGLTFDECGWRCVEEMEKILRENADSIAAVVLEPVVQGAAGMIVAPDGYLKRVERLCRKYRTLLVVDEVATGFGRTGAMFACFLEDVKPDILACAKGITGGYLPLAATLTTDEIYEAFLGDYAEKKTFFHGHTYTGNPLACAAALANIEIFEREGTLQKLKPKIAIIARHLDKISQLEHVGDVRQKGMMGGIELVRNRETKEPYRYEEKIGIRVCREARKKGLWIRPLGDVIVIMPPLCISEDDLDRMMGIIYDSITAVTE